MPIGIFILLVPIWYYLKTIDRVPFIIGPNESVYSYLQQDQRTLVTIILIVAASFLIYAAIVLYKCLRNVHGVTFFRGLLSFLVSVVLISLLHLYVLLPLDEVLKRLAFKE